MDTNELRRALAGDGDQFTPMLIERVVGALAGPPGTDGLPDLGFLPAPLQVAVLAAMYRDFIERAAPMAARRTPFQGSVL